MVSQENTPVIKCSAQGDVIDNTKVPGGKVNVNYLQWYNPSGQAGDLLLVSDGNGNDIWPEIWPGTNEVSPLHVLKHPVHNLTVTTMTRGTLYIIKAFPYGWPEG